MRNFLRKLCFLLISGFTIIGLILGLIQATLLPVVAQPSTPVNGRNLDLYLLNHVVLAGSHNTYEKKTPFEYIYDALPYVQVIERADVRTHLLTRHPSESEC